MKNQMTDTTATISDLKKVLHAFLKERDWYQFHNPQVDSIGAVIEAGELLELFLFSKPETDGHDVLQTKRPLVEDELADVWWWVVCFANTAEIDLVATVHLFLGTSAPLEKTEKETTIANIKQLLVAQGVRPELNLKNAAMHLSCTASGLMNRFLEGSRDGVGYQFLNEERELVELSLADLLIGIVLFAEAASIDLSAAAQRKMEKNAQKYPVEKSKGKPDKYTDL